MAQLINNWITPEDMVRSRAWREGFVSFRRGEPPEFTGRGSKSLAYEYGRQTAAYLKGKGIPLPWVSATRPLRDDHLPLLSEALLICTAQFTSISTR